MLLSIVECSDYRLWRQDKKQPLRIEKVSHDLEIIRSVVAASAAAMRNKGAAHASGDWLFFKDDDCKVSHEKLVRLVKKLEKHSIDLMGGTYRNRQQGWLTKSYNFIQRYWVFSGLTADRDAGYYSGEKLLGGALLVRKSCFQNLAGFNEKIGWGAEEVDFTNRAIAQGYCAKISFDLVVEHNNALGICGFMKRAWRQNYNRGFYQLSSNKQKARVWGYFNARYRYWAPLFVFFGVGTLAHTTGRVIRRTGRPWSF